MKHATIMKKSRPTTMVFAIVIMLTTSFTAQAALTLDSMPVRIAVNGDGNLLISDYTYGQVLTVNPDPSQLNVLGELTINGRPLGVAWADGLTYVGNASTGQVEAFNANGQMQFILGFGSVPVTSPQDIAIVNGNVYVVDGGAKVVKVFGLDGTYVGTLPHSGYDKNILATPSAITMDESLEKIYVSDYGDLGSTKAIAPRIQVFNLDGTLDYTIKSGQPNKYRFTMPQGLAVNNNKLFVVDANSAEIHVFDAVNGTLLNKVKGSGITKGSFAMQLPLDIIIENATNNVFVTNSRMASIKVFEGAGGI